jgi:hypothetical protein
MNFTLCNDFESCSEVMFVPRHHHMVCPQISVGGDGLQIWKVALNIRSKHLQIADKVVVLHLEGCAWGNNSSQ